MYAHLLCGNREIFVLPSVVVPRAASGRPEAVADDARDEEVTLVDSTCEAGEQSEQSAAESVEGDDGTKRNAELQSMVRTQGREAVSQAQDRIREAVNRNKKEKLTALLHHVSVDVLRWAFFNLKKKV